MNRDYYNNLSEAYQAMQEDSPKGSFERGKEAVGDTGKGIRPAVEKGLERAGKTGQAYTQGLFTGKKVASKAAPEMRAANAVGRLGSYGGKNFARTVKGAYDVGKAAYNKGKELGDKLKEPVKAGAGALTQFVKNAFSKEEVEALLNSPNLSEEEIVMLAALLDEERKDEAGMTPDEKSIGRSIKAGMNPLSDHMAAATRQRLHLSQRGKKKPTPHSKETRLPAQQLKAKKANDGVKEMGEEALLKALADELLESGGLGAGKSDAEKSAARNANAGYKPDNTFASSQRQMRGDRLRGQKKVPGAKPATPKHLTPAQELAHRTGMTKANLAAKHSGTAAGRRHIANNSLEAAERGGTKNNRGS